MIIRTNLNKNVDDSYDIVVERGILKSADKYLNLNRKVMIVSDSGIPKEYIKTLEACCKEPHIVVLEMGEGSKSLASLEKICKVMLENGFTRKDAVVALGGGVVGDMAGFSASIYMRGVDFYNIPTTLLSQVDSSIGGKTAINFGEIKNIVGSFYQPKKVLIDPELLRTLPYRQIANGLAEAVKMAMTFDAALFRFLETQTVTLENIDKVIIGSLEIKKRVVEQDEKEQGLRKVLNFGHTIGHGIESEKGMSELYHGECVALGMLPMCTSAETRARLTNVLKKIGLPTNTDCCPEKVYASVIHDKKSDSTGISVILVNQIGAFEIKKLTFDELKDIIYGEYSK